MFAVRSFIKSAPQAKMALQTSTSRQMSVITGPPKVRISFAEKLAHGMAIAGSMLAIPVWVLVNIKNYRTHE